MIEKVTQIAQQAAKSVSRRGFLGRLGRSAAATAAALGGFLAVSTIAEAGRRIKTCSELSGSCSGRSVGSSCGQGGTCQAVKIKGKKSKSNIVDCYCRGGFPGH